MTIEISDRARAWLRQKGGVATLRPSPRHGCCGGRADIAVAEVGAPDAPERYRHLEFAGITLYIDPRLADQSLTLDVEGFLGFRALFVEGASPSRG